MASAVDASGNPIPSSSVLMASWKHIGIRCHSENLDFLKCKKKDRNPKSVLKRVLAQGGTISELILADLRMSLV
ncbi:hypothetical protein LR48_Vigan06g149500 [Vigna angularis]|uniref:Uncharacterized protein n=1 Tax=Phaseolus angularis TaxID=3914 RepID=A0A0L9UUH7_PHAAN|nr:hypothetical protein LR48_Vigan06g149500 [Vigna angularis]